MKFATLNIVVLVAVLGGAVLAKPSRDNEAICATMTPTHGTVKPQSSPPPYTFTVPQKKLAPGQTITLSLRGNGAEDKIKGFIIQARETEVPVGRFEVINNEPTELLDCGEPGDTIIHKKATGNEDSNGISFKWIAPSDFTGTVKFYWTVVKEGHVFWAKKQSTPLTIG